MVQPAWETPRRSILIYPVEKVHFTEYYFLKEKSYVLGTKHIFQDLFL